MLPIANSGDQIDQTLPRLRQIKGGAEPVSTMQNQPHCVGSAEGCRLLYRRYQPLLHSTAAMCN
jgi:hypothetical protein